MKAKQTDGRYFTKNRCRTVSLSAKLSHVPIRVGEDCMHVRRCQGSHSGLEPKLRPDRISQPLSLGLSNQKASMWEGV